MKRTGVFVLLYCLSQLPATALARDMDEQYAVFGVGGDNCAAYRSQETRQALLNAGITAG